jgi:ABC-type bacteriocin/lantibiotic exporter with double-glycine peptidase domain
VFDRPAAVAEPAVPAALPTGPYGLRLRGLTAGWASDDAPVLRGVDAELVAGSRTMVVGPSGSGKSTLAAVLLRFLEPAAGSVQLVGRDGAVDLTELGSDDARSVIGWCAQDAHLFDSTIAENLRLARPDATPQDLWAALDGARLATWVHSLPAALDTMVGEHGRLLSGGQRQRLALARVLLADRPIVVLDEPTEHLDEPTARALAEDLMAATEGRTVVVLTHRPELFPEIERTLRIQAGRLVEVDPARAEPVLT